MAALISLITERALYLISLLLLLFTQAALLSAAHPAPALIFTATILTGAALGPLYPLIVSFLLSRTGQHARLGSLFAFASLGGATLPWLTGVVSTHFGGLRPGLLVPAAGTLIYSSPSPPPSSRAARSTTAHCSDTPQKKDQAQAWSLQKRNQRVALSSQKSGTGPAAESNQ